MMVFSVLIAGDVVSLSIGDRIEQGKDKNDNKELSEPVSEFYDGNQKQEKRRESRSALRLWLSH